MLDFTDSIMPMIIDSFAGGGDWHWRDFPKDVQVSCVGNSVCPPLAEALVRANCGHLTTGHIQDNVRETRGTSYEPRTKKRASM